MQHPDMDAAFFTFYMEVQRPRIESSKVQNARKIDVFQRQRVTPDVGGILSPTSDRPGSILWQNGRLNAQHPTAHTQKDSQNAAWLQSTCSA